ncbi:aminobutyraldehyde dehydrogenase [Paradevosia shaoguanensis]|uniref:Aminobutyraldehyde dehydrogenase n=1 Tax=Paradevosia shaoguanensis TaxID=1335043 RepID=A0AA41UD78_9HYPH|nr:aminobutyraldehyde dehydrogenase [Paradevosia shaoguanensis]MCF1744890.1 aminobutyraldehyde dehydrogenase [Paradevosia shaoguanensis]MCI0129373.1 aminobutyraldehyde dehydrogenase [Paradevosia shaoguanensis]
MTHVETRLFINGDYVPGQGQTEAAYEPGNGTLIADVASAAPDQVDSAVLAANAAFKSWRRTTPKERSRALLRIADAIEANSLTLGALESRNSGKPLRYAQSFEIANVADVFRYFGTAIRNVPGTVANGYRSPKHLSVLKRDPIGVIASIAPWNYPLLMAAWKLAPAIAAGNTVVIKPSENTPLSLLMLAGILAEFLPPGVVNVVLGNGPDVGQRLITHPLVRMISLTGDIRTGRAVLQAAAGESIKRTHLELGGKAPVIVCDDADIDVLVETLREASFYNAGQDCTAACRIFVDKSIAQLVTDRLAAMIETIPFGTPERDDVEFGPVITARQRERIAGFIDRAGASGADIVTGGKAPDQAGFYYAPTLVAAPIDAEIVQKEVFGPVVSITSFDTVETAIEWANASEYGLASSVWSRNANCALAMAEALEYGVTWVNTHGVFATEMPHGGMKNSGYGSDLSMQSLIDYTQARHIMIAS